MAELSGKQKRRLRALGHHLRPAAVVGREGITEAVRRAVDQALEARGLVKVKVGRGCPAGRQAVARELAAATGASVAQVLGRTILLFRPGGQDRGADDRGVRGG